METTGKVVIGLLVAVAGYFLIFGTNGLPSTPLTTTPSQSTGFASQPVATTTTQQYKDAITLLVALNNKLNATQFTDDTTADIEYFFKDSAGTYQFLKKSSSNTIDVGTALTGGFVYANIDIQASQGVYTDVAGTIANSPDVKGCVYADADNDNFNMYVCQIDISPYLTNPNPANQPKLSWIASFYGEGSIHMNTAASSANVATGSTQSVVEWQAIFDRLAVAEAVRQVQVRTNTTTLSVVDESNSYVSLPWGTVKLSDMSRSYDYSNTRTIYAKNYVTTSPLEGAQFFSVGNSGSLTINTPFTITTGFTASTDALCVELEYTTVNARGTTTAVSDDAEITAHTTSGLSSGNECTL